MVADGARGFGPKDHVACDIDSGEVASPRGELPREPAIPAPDVQGLVAGGRNDPERQVMVARVAIPASRHDADDRG